MQIEKVECFPLKIPGHPYVGGHDDRKKSGTYGNYINHSHYRAIYIADAQALLVKITTDTGIVGWGETQASLVPQLVAGILDEVVTPGLIGENPFDRAVLRDQIYDRTRDRGHDSGLIVDAISACDIALWDIVGKATGKPVCELLGGKYRTQIPCYVSGVHAETAEEQIEKIEAWLEKGFTNFKISLGFGVQEDIEHVRKLHEALGNRAQILIDSHWAFNLNEAIEVGRAFEKLGVRFMECPMNSEVIETHSSLCEALDLPIALGEEFRTRYRFKERLERKALDIAQPDIGRLGITEGFRVINLCNAFDIPSAPHIGSGLGVYTAASLHVAAATEHLYLLEFQPSQIDVSDLYFSPSLRPTEGSYQLSLAPGLGVEPDEEKLAEHIFRK